MPYVPFVHECVVAAVVRCKRHHLLVSKHEVVVMSKTKVVGCKVCCLFMSEPQVVGYKKLRALHLSKPDVAGGKMCLAVSSNWMRDTLFAHEQT